MSFRSDKTIETVAGNRNYMPNARLDSAVSLGYNRGSVTWTSGAPSGAPTVGTAASITTLALSATSPLNGYNSLNVASSGAWSQGQGVITDIITIDKQDQAHVLQGTFKYEVVSGGTSANWSGTSSNTLSVWIYDITNTTWVQPQGVYNLVQSSGVGECSFTFQTASNASQYRVFIVAANASSGALSLRLDDFYLGSQRIVYGAPVTDLIAYTPTLTTSGGGNITLNSTGVVNPNGFWRRVGDSAEVTVSFRNGSGGAATGAAGFVRVGLPPGLVPNNTKIATTVAGVRADGYASIGASTGLEATIIVDVSGFALIYAQGAGTYVSVSDLASGYIFTATFKYAVTGWSSNVVMSNDTDTRVVAARYKTATGSIANNSISIVNFETKDFDTHSVVTTGGSWKFTVPVSGVYNVSAGVALDSNAEEPEMQLRLYKNNSFVAMLDYKPAKDLVDGTNGILRTNGSTLIELVAGDYIDVRFYKNSSGGGTLGYAVSSEYNHVSINRLSGPSVIAASESVNFGAYRATSNQTATAGTPLEIIPNTKRFDTHSAYNTSNGRFTAPVSGTYLLNANIVYATGGTPPSQVGIYFLKNGTGNQLCNLFWTDHIASKEYAATASAQVYLNAGEYVSFWIFPQGQNATVVSSGSGNDTTAFYATRIGN
jgi:hypothetical protein